ncbi:hypothetical protein PGQ11_000075 [Apiospora arundinis]
MRMSGSFFHIPSVVDIDLAYQQPLLAHAITRIHPERDAGLVVLVVLRGEDDLARVGIEADAAAVIDDKTLLFGVVVVEPHADHALGMSSGDPGAHHGIGGGLVTVTVAGAGAAGEREVGVARAPGLEQLHVVAVAVEEPERDDDRGFCFLVLVLFLVLDLRDLVVPLLLLNLGLLLGLGQCGRGGLGRRSEQGEEEDGDDGLHYCAMDGRLDENVL